MNNLYLEFIWFKDAVVEHKVCKRYPWVAVTLCGASAAVFSVMMDDFQ